MNKNKPAKGRSTENETAQIKNWCKLTRTFNLLEPKFYI